MLVLSPGPGICDPKVLEVMSKPCIHHRSEEFKGTYKQIVKELKKLVHAPRGEVIILNGSGTYGMEGAVRNLLEKGDSVLSIRCGYFSDRFFQLARQRGCVMYSLQYPDYATYRLEDVEGMLQEHRCKALLVTHSESETGSLQDLRPLGTLCQKYGVLLIVDSISGVVMNEVDMEAMHIDCLVMASQKGFLMPPGLSMSVLSPQAVRAMKHVQTDSYVFDYKTILKKYHHDFRIHSTPCIPLYLGLNTALHTLNRVSMKQLAAHYHELHSYLQEELESLNFTILSKQHASNSLIVCKVPPQQRASHMQRALEAKGIRIETGLCDKEDIVLRIGIMNAVSKKHLETLVYHLRSIVYET